MNYARSLKKNFRFHTRSLLLTNILYSFCFFAFLVPLANRTLKLIMRLSKVSYITEENAFSLLLSPHAIFLLLILIIIVYLYIMAKLSSLIFYCNTEGILEHPYLRSILFFGLSKPIKALRNRQFTLILFTLPFYVFANLPVLIGILIYTDLEFTEGFTELLIKNTVILLLISISFFSLRGIFAYLYCIQENISFTKALAYAKELLEGRRRRTLLTYLVYNLVFTFSFLLLYYALLFIAAVATSLTADKNIAISVFLSAYLELRLYATLVFGMIVFVLNINLTTSLFHTYRSEIVHTKLPFYQGIEYDFSYRTVSHKHIINGILICLVLLGMINLFKTFYNDATFFNVSLLGVQISSHRGNSHIAPENTIPALESAIIANSDYAEVDVRQTKDGTLVLMHDRSLLRTAGVNQFIWELTDPEVYALDVGSWFSLDYLDTHIPTLEEVLIYCKDRIKLNIEVKVNSTDQNLEEKLIALIKEYEYENQCVVSSTNYQTLKKIKLLNRDIHTGYILSAVYGDFYTKDYIDFFSIRYNFVNSHVVNSAHEAGKEIHVWTVNNATDLERMKSIGVDCIITDNPSLTREVLYRDDTNDNFIQLMNRMLHNRSLYRLTQLLN